MISLCRRKFSLNVVFAVSSKRAKNTMTFKMAPDKAYLRFITETEQFQLGFHFTSENPRLSRQFNFLRQNSESVGTLIARVKANVEKYLNKKNKKDALCIEAALTANGEKVQYESSCKDIFETRDRIVLSLADKKYDVIVNSPWVDAIQLSNCLLSNFPIYFKKLELKNATVESSKFCWYRSSDLKDWIPIGQSAVYVPTDSDVDKFLKISVLPQKEGYEGPETEIVSNVKVQVSPKRFPFEDRHKFTKEVLKGRMFRTVSYNILADLYCDMDYTREFLFPYTPAYALSMEYRRQLLLKEIIGYNADIICLQEVDKKIFLDFEPILQDYEGDFCLKDGGVMEGSACFYRKSRFNKICSHRLALCEHIETHPIFADISAKIAENDNLRTRILGRSTVLSIIGLDSKENAGEILVVANTHLYFHPNADNIRLLQGSLIIKYLEEFLINLQKDTNKRVSLILCGDFNSSPDCGIYKLYTTGQVSDKDCVDFQSNSEEVINGITIQHSLKLSSACGTPKYTNFTAGFADCLDYIFYENTKLAVTQVVPLPSDEDLKEHTALPSIVFPSDHLALVTDLEWT